MPIKKKVALISAISLAVLLLLSITALPWIIRSQAVKAIQESTGRIAHINKVAFNPFTLTVNISGFRLEGEQGTPLIKTDNIRVSLGSASIFKRALVIDELIIHSPALSFTRLGDNTYSFSDILEHQKMQPKKVSKSELRYSINNIGINNGSIDFADNAVNGGKKHTVRKLEVAIPFISNIPYLLETYTDPKLSAEVNGSSFSFGGKVKPLSKSRETAVKIQLKQFGLARYIPYSPIKLPVDLSSGSLTIDTEVNYKISPDKKPELTVKGLMQLNGIAINRSGGEALLRFPLLQVKASRLEIFARQFSFDSILLDGLEIFASRDRKGQWMFSSILAAATPAAKPNPGKLEKTVHSRKAQEKATFSVASLAISNGSVHFSDARPAGGFKTSLTEIDLTIKNVSNTHGNTADYELSMLQDREAELGIDGTFSMEPLAATAAVELNGLRLQKGWPYLAQFLTAPVKGTLNAALDLSYSMDNGLEAANGSLGIKGFSTSYGNQEGVELAQVAVNGAHFSQKNNRCVIDEVRLGKGSLSLSKESDGRLSLLSLIRDRKPDIPVTPSTKAVATKPTKDSKPFHWSLKRFQLERFNLSLTDKSRAEIPKFALTNSQLALTNLNGPTFTPAGLKFSAIFNGGAALKANGVLTPLPFRYKGEFSVGRLQIRDFEDYFPEALNVFIIGGSIDSAMNVDISLKDGKPFGSFSGNCGVRAFHSIDAIAEEDLLKWESLQLDQIRGSLAPFSLGIREVALNGVYSRIVVRKDGTLNLQNLVDKPEPAQQTTADGTQQPRADKQPPRNMSQGSGIQGTATAPVAKTPIAIGAVTVQDGTISFTDRHLPQTFNSTFYNLGGRVSGLSSEDAKLADVDLRGNLENHSPLQITGRMNPLRDDLFIDLKLSFKDIDLSPVTPYSGTYLGYTVEKGKLFLDLKYLIDKKLLSSENNVFIDQFTFGSKVESEKATSLPVRLAVALLKDRKGEIHLDLPVTGRTDDPQFSIWGVVWQVVKNLVTKAVTSPFSLLSSMFGGGQDFSSVQFAIGSSRLAATEELKLNALAKALIDRPGLKVEIKGYVERERDSEGYRQELLEQKLRNEKFLTLVKERQVKEGETADSIRVLPEESSKLLKAVYKKEKFPKPRNAIGLVKDLPDAEMKKLIIANTVVGEPELQGLARDRSTAVMNFLVSKGGLPAERLFQKNEDIHKAPEKTGTVRSRVEFNAIAQ